MKQVQFQASYIRKNTQFKYTFCPYVHTWLHRCVHMNKKREIESNYAYYFRPSDKKCPYQSQNQTYALGL